MLVRFSTRVCNAPARLAAASASPAVSSSWFGRRYCSEKADAKAEEKTEEKKDDAKTKATAHEEVADLKEQLKKANEAKDEFKKELLYTKADAENARRIGREDTEKARNFAVTGFGKDMLEVADTLERTITALNTLPQELVDQHKALASILTGVKMSDSVLASAFGKHGIEKMKTETGTAFDPNCHDALFNAPATEAAPAGTIANVVKVGYKIKDRVLRPAAVGVAEEQK